MRHGINSQFSNGKDGPRSLSPHEAQAEADTAARLQKTDVFALPDDRRVRSYDDIVTEVNRVVERMNQDPGFVGQAGEFDNTTLVLSATDTGRELMITLDDQGIRAGPYTGERFDVKIRATEKVHWAVLSGQMDADAAFFTRKVRISGCLSTAFRVKNRFLSLLQWHLTNKHQARGHSAADGC